MSQREPGLISIELPSKPVAPGSGSLLAAPVTSLTRAGRQLTKDEEYISNKLRTDLAIQLGTAVKEEHGAYLSQLISQRSVTRFDEYVEFDREVMDKPRSKADDQADILQFCAQMRQMQANTLMAIRQGAVNKIEEVVLTPLDPPEDKGEDVIVEQKPGLLGAIFGGQTVTRVKR